MCHSRKHSSLSFLLYFLIYHTLQNIYKSLCRIPSYIRLVYLPSLTFHFYVIHQFLSFSFFPFLYQINQNYHITSARSLFSESNDITTDRPTSPIAVIIKHSTFSVST